MFYIFFLNSHKIRGYLLVRMVKSHHTKASSVLLCSKRVSSRRSMVLKVLASVGNTMGVESMSIPMMLSPDFHEQYLVLSRLYHPIYLHILAHYTLLRIPFLPKHSNAGSPTFFIVAITLLSVLHSWRTKRFTEP